MKTWVLIPIFGLVAFIIFLVVLLMGGMPNIGGIPGQSKHYIECEVDITNALLENPKIEKVYCEQGNSCSFNPFLQSIWVDPGRIKLSSGGTSVNTRYNIAEVERQVHSLKVCSADTDYSIELINEEGVQIDRHDGSI